MKGGGKIIIRHKKGSKRRAMCIFTLFTSLNKVVFCRKVIFLAAQLAAGGHDIASFARPENGGVMILQKHLPEGINVLLRWGAQRRFREFIKSDEVHLAADALKKTREPFRVVMRGIYTINKYILKGKHSATRHGIFAACIQQRLQWRSEE